MPQNRVTKDHYQSWWLWCSAIGVLSCTAMTLGWFWSWSEPKMDSCTRYHYIQKGKYPILPCIHGLWYCVSLSWYRWKSAPKCVDEAQMDMFAWKQRHCEAIPPNSRGTIAACKESCLPGQPYMESDNASPPRNTQSCWVGMDQKRESLEYLLDRASRYCAELSTVDTVWIQDIILW